MKIKKRVLDEDWQTKVPTQERLKDTLEQVKSKLPMESLTYSTPESFVKEYSYALQNYLERTMGKGKSHIEDLGSHASAFAEAFACISARRF
jgi:hypothetical protein